MNRAADPDARRCPAGPPKQVLAGSKSLALLPTGSPYLPTERASWGAGVETWDPEVGQHGALIAPELTDLGRVVALAAADAFEHGVEVDDIAFLPPQPWKRADGTESLPSFLPQRDRSMRALEREISVLVHRAQNDRDSASDSATSTERREWQGRARDAERAAQRLRRELEQLRNRPADELDLPAILNAGPVVYALMRVACAEPAPDLAEVFAVQQIIRELDLEPDGLLLHGSFKLAVPTSTRLLILGPIGFTLTNRCRNGVALLLQHADFTRCTMAPSFRTRAERQRLVAALQSAPLSLTRRAANTAASAYFAAIPQLLLGEASGQRERAWNDPGWAAHLRTNYRRRRRPASGPWYTFEPARQALSYAVADATGPLTRADVVEVLSRYGVSSAATRVQQYTVDPRQGRALTSTSWSWPPAVMRAPSGHGRDGWHAELRRCPLCGGPAELVVNAPELPYACMCPCGGAPGVPGRVPALYRALTATRKELNYYGAALALEARTSVA